LIEGQSTVSNNETSSGEFKTWMCLICGWVYDEAAGLPDEGIAPGTRWEDVPMNWTCPECGARKEDFEMVAI
jgi:rubredoxin